MNDEVRDMIGKALAGEPPLRIDYDTVHAAGRRRLARRHLGIVGGAVLTVIAVAGGAVAIGQLNAGPATGPAVPPATIGSGTSVAPQAKGCVVAERTGGFSAAPDGTATEAELAESARLSEAFARFAPPLPADVTMEPATPRLCAIDRSWGTDFTLRYPGGERAVFLEVLPRAGQEPDVCTSFRGAHCATTERPDGSVVMITESPAAGPDQPVLVNVRAWRADGTIVRILETGTEGPQPRPRVLDDQALIAIATAPELKVDWTGPPRPAEPTQRRAIELTAALTKARPLPDGMRAQSVRDARHEPLAFYISQGGYKLDADLADAAGAGALFITLNPPAPDASVPDCAGQVGCEPIWLPDGRKVTLTRQAQDSITTLILNAVASDGTQISIMSRNLSAAEVRSKDAGPGNATRPEPPLDARDLIRIASIPGLHW